MSLDDYMIAPQIIARDMTFRVRAIKLLDGSTKATIAREREPKKVLQEHVFPPAVALDTVELWLAEQVRLLADELAAQDAAAKRIKRGTRS